MKAKISTKRARKKKQRFDSLLDTFELLCMFIVFGVAPKYVRFEGAKWS